MGLEQAGMEIVYQCELDKKCQSVLKRHWPNIPLHDDVSTLTGKMVLDAVGSVDLVAWGSPCQDLSIAGNRTGLGGDKSGLFYEGIRVIDEIRKESNNEYPRWSIWENVRGAFSSNHGHDFATVIDQMAETGAVEIEWRLLDAQFFGVAQRRKRIFVIAGFHPRTDDIGSIFAITKSMRRNPTASAKTGEKIARTLGSGSGTRGLSSDTDRMTFVPTIAAAVCARYAKGPGQTVDPGQVIVVPKTYPTLTTDFGDKMCQNNQAVDGGYLLVTPIHDQATRWAGKNGEKTAGKGNGLGVGDPGDSMPTLTKGDRHAVFIENDAAATVDRVAVRRLTPRECERLMGWPDDHTRWDSDDNEVTDGHRYRMCGNGVVSNVAKWVGERVMDAENCQKEGCERIDEPGDG